MLVDDERRDFRRMIAETQMEVMRLSSGETLTARLVNLSASGCAFMTDWAVEPSEELEVVIRGSSDRLDPFRRAGQVARVTQEEEGHLVALHFVPEQT